MGEELNFSARSARRAVTFSLAAADSVRLDSLRSKLSKQALAELEALSQETQPEIYFAGLLNFAQRLQDRGNAEAAAEVYSSLVHQLPDGDAVHDAAKSRLNALLGTGSAGLRAEVLLKDFAQSATSYQTIVPMIAGSAVYQIARVSTLGRLAAGARASWLTRGLGMRLTAATAGMAVEVPVFALGSRGLMALGGENIPWDGVSVGKDLLGATITLGALKVFGHVGNQAAHSVRARGAIRELPLQGIRDLSIQVIPQVAVFGGLMAAHRLEEGIGLRPHVDGATAATDALASMVSLGVGSHLGKRHLGGNFSKFQNELEARVRNDGFRPEFPGITSSAWASTVGARHAVPEKMLHIQLSTGKGRSGESSAEIPFIPILQDLVMTTGVEAPHTGKELAEQIGRQSERWERHFNGAEGRAKRLWAKLLSLELKPFSQFVSNSDPVRQFLILMDKLGNPTAFEALFEPAKREAKKQLWAVYLLDVLRLNGHEQAGLFMENLDVSSHGVEARSAQQGDSIGLPALAILYGANNSAALAALSRAAIENPAAIFLLRGLSQQGDVNARQILQNLECWNMLRLALVQQDKVAVLAAGTLALEGNDKLPLVLEEMLRRDPEILDRLAGFERRNV